MHRALFLGFWLLAAVGLAASSQGGLLVHALFRLQQEHIAEHHCEERDDPDSDCDGFCFLKKRLAEADDHSDQAQAQAPASPVLFFLPAPSPALTAPASKAHMMPPRSEHIGPEGILRVPVPPPRFT